MITATRKSRNCAFSYGDSPGERRFTPVSVAIDQLLCLPDPLTPQTENLIDKNAISKMKKEVIIINTSRGPVVNDKDLAEALNNGDVQAAGVDVLRVEPPTADNPLLTAENCIITPHIAWAAYETRKRLLGILEDNLKAFLDGNPQNVVNK